MTLKHKNHEFKNDYTQKKREKKFRRAFSNTQPQTIVNMAC